MAALPALYDPMLERDAPAIRQAARLLAADRGLDELYLSVARFALLAYAPSQHAKHAVTAALAAHELRDEAGEHWLDLISEVAVYAADSREPWSEPPILDPPPLDEDQRGDLDELREATASQDRLRAERWLAKRIDDRDLERDLMIVAAEDASDFGHRAILTATATRLSHILGEKGRFAAMRIAVWEMCAHGGEGSVTPVALPELLNRAIAEQGSFEPVHVVFLFEALRRSARSGRARGAPVYPFARDYAQLLEAHMVVKRLEPDFPNVPWDAFLAAVKKNSESPA